MQLLQQIIGKRKRVFVFLGESGSGKSEIALNWALLLAVNGKPVHFFDMDQTKPLFRSRELTQFLKAHMITINDQVQILDSPTIPSGVFDRIQDPNSYVVLDVGGNVAGALSLGQLRAAWSEEVAVYGVVNCYRPFSGSRKELVATMDSIIRAARLENVRVISSPNFGAQTTLEDIIRGHKQTKAFLEQTPYPLDMIAALNKFKTDIQIAFPEVGILGITRYIKAPWEEQSGILAKREE